MEKELPDTMIYFVKGVDDEINSALEDLRKEASRKFNTATIDVHECDIDELDDGYIVAEMCDVPKCLSLGIDHAKMIGIGYSCSSYIGFPKNLCIHRHFVTSRAYNSSGKVVPFGYSSQSKIKSILDPKIIAVCADFEIPHLKNLDDYKYVINPDDHEQFDILVYATSTDRYSRIIRRAVSEGIPTVGYNTTPLMKDLIDNELAFELDPSDDFENAITNTISYISSNIPWQLFNSVGLFKYSQQNLNWDKWLYELEHL